MTLPSLPFSRNCGRSLPFLAFFGLFAVWFGCARAENEQKSDTSSNSATQTATEETEMAKGYVVFTEVIKDQPRYEG